MLEQSSIATYREAKFATQERPHTRTLDERSIATVVLFQEVENIVEVEGRQENLVDDVRNAILCIKVPDGHAGFVIESRGETNVVVDVDIDVVAIYHIELCSVIEFVAVQLCARQVHRHEANQVQNPRRCHQRRREM